MKQRHKRYERIIRFVQEKPTVTLEAFIKKYPEIPSSTYHSTLNALKKHGLLEKRAKAKNRIVYKKTEKFTVETAIDTLKAANRQFKGEETANVEEAVREAVRHIVDPATGLTFAQMQIDIEVKERGPGIVEIDFVPVFCPIAAELSTYIKNMTSQKCNIREASVYCLGHAPRIRTNE